MKYYLEHKGEIGVFFPVFIAAICVISGYRAAYEMDIECRHSSVLFKRITIHDKWRRLFFSLGNWCGGIVFLCDY